MLFVVVPVAGVVVLLADVGDVDAADDEDCGVGVVFPIVEFAFGVAFDDGVSLRAASPSVGKENKLIKIIIF